MANVKTFLSAVGADAKKLFGWLGSSQGQTLISTGEAVVEAVDPALTGIVSIANTYLTEILKTENIATNAGAQSGTGVQKSAAVVSAVTPQVLAYAKAAGLPTLTAEQIQNAATAAVAFLNAFPAPTA